MNEQFSEQTKRYIEGQSSRNFPIDVFISHNQDDTSHVFAQELIEKELTVWYDQYSDLTDGKVRTVIIHSLRNARFLVLCIGNGFRDSEWCRAEYMPALKTEQKLETTRILVALLNQDAVVPAHLLNCRQFPIYQEGVAPLVKFIKANNFVSFRRLKALEQASQLSKTSSRLINRLNKLILRDVKPFVNYYEDFDVGKSIVSLANKAPKLINKTEFNFEFENELLSFRYNLYCNNLFQRSFKKSYALSLLLLVRIAYILASNYDMRANALYIALWVGLTSPGTATRRICIALLCQEYDKKILEQAQAFVEYLLESSMTGNHFSSKTFKEHQDISIIVKTLNNKVSDMNKIERLKIHLKNQPVLQDLSLLEQICLWRKRISYVCKVETQGIEINDRDWLGMGGNLSAKLFNISTTELVLRDLHEILFYYDSPRPLDTDEQKIFSIVIEGVEEIVEVSENNQGKPLILSDEYYIDTLLDVFILLITSGKLERDRVLQLSERTHKILEQFASEEIKRQVPSYRNFLQDITQGVDLDTAKRRFLLNLS